MADAVEKPNGQAGSEKGAAPSTKPPDPATSPAKKARQTLDEVTAQRKAAADENARLEKTRAEVIPLTKKAAEFEADRKLITEDPRAWLEKYGIDRSTLTEKLAAEAIKDVENKTPEGLVAAVNKRIDDLEAAEKKAKEEKEQSLAADLRRKYALSLAEGVKAKHTVDGVEKLKFPLTAKAAKAEFGDDLPSYLWEVGRGVDAKKVEAMKKAGKTEAEIRDRPAPTADEVLAVVEKRYDMISKGLATADEPGTAPAPAPGDKSAKEIADAAAARRKATKEADKAKAASPVGQFKRPETTLAQRKAAARSGK